MRTLDAVIAESPAFAHLDLEHLALVAGCGRNVSFDQDDRLFREGDPANEFYLVRRGLAALETYVPNRGQVTIYTAGPGEILGWSWLVAPHRWHFSGRAIDGLQAIRFDGQCLRRKCEDDPRLGYALLTRFAQLLVERLQATRLQVMDIYGDDR
jgi:CRP-like cAMP-binding protein